MRRSLLIAIVASVSLLATAASAQAVVVDMNALGQSTVSYDPSNRANYTGVALVPGTRSKLATAHVPTVVPSPPCTDPALTADLSLPATGLCFEGGAVIHSNETFALTWDPARSYWSGTKNYVEQFLRDLADSSGSLASPYAVATQYTGPDVMPPGANGRAGNTSKYGGACNDYGQTAGSSCQFGSTTQSGAGNNYPSSGGCTASGSSYNYSPLTVPNTTCLTDAQLQQELQGMVQEMGILGRTQPGYTPTIVLLTPPTVEVCLDSAGTLCSANSSATTVKAQFCSYHSQLDVGGTTVPYVVQPWTQLTGCDEPDIPQLPSPPTPPQIDADAGARLVSALSQAQLGSITNPELDGWFALDGSEINDNGGCHPLGGKQHLDDVTLGSSGQNPYLLQREFNNAGVIVNDPITYFGCAPQVALSPAFVVPSAVDQGDTVEFDGSATASTLIVPDGNYQWDFGDGVTAVGPSAVHTYATGGVYTVKLTVTDRGGNTATLTQTINVLGPNGQPVTTPVNPSNPGNPGNNTPPPPPPPAPKPTLRVRLLLMPQSLTTVLRTGMTVLVAANEAANGFAKLSISRRDAQRAHLHVGRGPSLVVGQGTVSGVKSGTVSLRVHMSPSVAAKLKRLKHVTLTLQLSLRGADGNHLTIDAAGHY